MTRAATADHVFSAIAEPRRREIIDLLWGGGAAEAYAVGAIVKALGLPQPAVSKHLGVLRQVGIVTVTCDGRRRLYRLDARELKAVHDWTRTFDRFWTHQLQRIKARAEGRVKERATGEKHHHHDQENRPC
ncbi:MAG: ArsR/SmtB family transcription factor [Phycisphaerales bacterium]